MASGVQRAGDQNSGGGVIIASQTSVRCDGRPISVTGDAVTSHTSFDPPHTCAKTQATQTAIRINGKPIVRTGDPDTCGHVRIGGSTTLRI